MILFYKSVDNCICETEAYEKGCKYIPEYLHKDLYARIAPQRGDLLLAKNGTTGIAAVVDCD
ncbi:MAG: hypothetical protein UH824_03340, partial [Acutalibacteraceae bacterium]|nr:hypothetical protein [Acutalibacteraceae bacterium]